MGEGVGMKRAVKIIVIVAMFAFGFMAEGAMIAVGIMRNGVSFETPSELVFEVKTEGHEFELVER